MNYRDQILKPYFGLLCVLLISAFAVQAQAPQSLQEKYQKLIDDYETYERYKVIPKTELDAFWAQVQDTVNQGQIKIRSLQDQIGQRQQKTDTLQRNIEQLQIALDKSNAINDRIIFLGIPFSKMGYHITVWVIIGILAVLCLIAYSMYSRSNKITRKSQKELDTLKADFEQHKDRSREKEVKLKRELQTAVNTIDEMKRRR